MSILAINAGAAYQIESLLGERYCMYFDKVVRPEELSEVDLSAFETLLIPCRTPSHRLIAHKHLFQAHLEKGGTIIAMGECHSERWLSNIVFTPLETNFWWWLDPQGDLGLQIKVHCIRFLNFLDLGFSMAFARIF